jgi:putative tricarboxylic transport membrane protein
MMGGLISGFLGALSPENLLYCFLGCTIGTVVGVLPGLGPAATMAILLPLTSYLPPEGMILMLAGIYYGAMYGGSTTSILINVPGEASSVTTCLDGFQLTKQGRAGEALAIAAIASFIAGTAGVVFLSFGAPALADFALRFGPPEYFTVLLFSLTAVLSFAGPNLPKGVIAAVGGMLLASVGLDPLTGKQRFVFGFDWLISGFDVIPIVVGLFGIAEVLSSAEEGVTSIYRGSLGRLISRGKELKKGLLGSLRGTALGLVLGLLPGMSPAVGAFMAYDLEKRVSRNPERFGQGQIEGVAAPEAANNAVAQAGFIPLMALGIPTCPMLAILLAAFTMYGLTPGPLLFQKHSEIAWTVIASMYVGNIVLLVLNLPLVGFWARISLTPYRILGPLVLGICVVGAFSMRNNLLDIWVCVLFGILGYWMKQRNWPAVPFIIGLIIGPMVEQNFRGALGLSGGDVSIFLSRPIAAVFLGLTVLSLVLGRRALALSFKSQGHS